MTSTSWQFKKSLESKQAYQDSRHFRSLIERGDKETLQMTIREMHIILSEPHQQPFAKFQTLRFCRDILLLGNVQVVSALERLVPPIVQVCSYRIDNQSHDQGSTYFQDHPNYLKASEAEREELKILGSSFLFICLESIETWARWIPYNQNGSESVFKKAFNSLLQRGVVFKNTNQYYRKADDEKQPTAFYLCIQMDIRFKMPEFFENSDIDDQSENVEPLNQLLVREVDRLETIKILLSQLMRQSKQPPMQDLYELKNQVHHIYYASFPQIQRVIELQKKNEYDENKNLQVLFQEQTWAENFLQNYIRLTNKQILYADFAKIYAVPNNDPKNKDGTVGDNQFQANGSFGKNLAFSRQQFGQDSNSNGTQVLSSGANIFLKKPRQLKINVEEINLQANQNMGESRKNMAVPVDPKTMYMHLPEESQLGSMHSSQQQLKDEYQALLKTHKTIKSSLQAAESELRKKNEELKNVIRESQAVQSKTVQEYEERISRIKAATVNDRKFQLLTREKMDLQNRLRTLEEKAAKLAQENSQLIRRQQEQKSVVPQVDSGPVIISLENELKDLRLKYSQQQELVRKFKENVETQQRQIEFERSLREKIEKEIELNKLKAITASANEERLFGEIEKFRTLNEKAEKERLRIQEELQIYKEQLNEQRGKKHMTRDLEIQRIQEVHTRTKKELEETKKMLLSKIQELDVRDIEIIRLQERNSQTERLMKEITVQQSIAKNNPYSPDKAEKISGTPMMLRTATQNPIYQSSDKLRTKATPLRAMPYEELVTPANPQQFTRTKSPFGTGFSPFNQRQQFSSPGKIESHTQFYEFFSAYNRELFLRYCKCNLKSKDLLYKENQLQIGLISQRLSGSKLRFLLHYTNNSEVPLRDFKTTIYSPKNIRTMIISDVSNHIEPATQEKQEITHEILQHPICKIGLELSYDKNGKHETLNLLLPVSILKLVEYRRVTDQRAMKTTPERREFQQSSKILQGGKHIASYIPQIREVSPQALYDVDVIHQSSQLSFYLKIMLSGQSVALQAFPTGLSPLSLLKQNVLKQYMNSLQFVFSK